MLLIERYNLFLFVILILLNNSMRTMGFKLTIILLFVSRAVSVSRRNIQRQFDNLERRYEQDYVSVKESLRSLWDIVDQLETINREVDEESLVISTKQTTVLPQYPHDIPADLTRLVHGLSEEKEFMRKKLKDIAESMHQMKVGFTGRAAEIAHSVNEVNVRCGDVEKEVKQLQLNLTLLVEKIEKTRKEMDRDVNGLRLETKGIVDELMVKNQLNVKQALSVETYSLSYNYFDEIAQSYCASKGSAWVFAVRRNCGGVAPTCNDICSGAKYEILKFISNQMNSVSCFDAFHIKKEHPVFRANPSHEQPDAGKVNLGTYGYGRGGCTWKPNHCGPNYCCCKAY